MKPIDAQVVREVRPEVPERPELTAVAVCDLTGKWFIAPGNSTIWIPNCALTALDFRIPSEAECAVRKERAELVARVVDQMRTLIRLCANPDTECCDTMDALDAFDAAHPEIGGGV